MALRLQHPEETSFRKLMTIDHPLPSFISKGISVSLNSDDPPFFHTSVGLEYINSAKHMNISLEKLKNISLMAMDASFADADTKSRLMNKIIEF